MIAINHFGFWTLIILLIASCARKPIGTFDESSVPNTPDYSQSRYWAALPNKLDSADVLLASSFKNVQENAKVDVFFLHPTTYIGKKGERNWNASVDNSELNERTDGSTIKYQASIFNGVGRVFAPRYRQIQLQAFEEFYTDRKESAERATALAYSDVKRAFEYYLQNYNNNRPIIIAAHSQGTVMAKELLKDFFDGKSLQEKLVTAYLVGIIVPEGYFKHIPPCDSSSETQCFNTWRTFQRDYEPERSVADTIVVTNPLTWKTNAAYAPAELNKGVIINDKQKVYENIIDAQVNESLGILWITKPKRPLRLRFFPSKNFHIGDYNLFYLNVRENAVERVNSYLEASKRSN